MLLFSALVVLSFVVVMACCLPFHAVVCHLLFFGVALNVLSLVVAVVVVVVVVVVVAVVILFFVFCSSYCGYYTPAEHENPIFVSLNSALLHGLLASFGFMFCRRVFCDHSVL